MFFYSDDKDAFENHRLCHKCGGRCCKNSPCVLDKSDLHVYNPSDIADTITKNKFTIRTLDQSSWYLNLTYFDFPYLYLSSKGEYDLDVNMLTLLGPCLNLTDKGCAFNSKERPKGGRMLVPRQDFTCSYENSKEVFNLIRSWRCMQRELREAAEIMTGSTVCEMASTQYQAIINNEESFLDDEMLRRATYDFKKSYQFCKLVREYGLILSPNVMDLLDTFITRFPEKKELVLSELKEIPNLENYNDSFTRNLIYEKFMRG